MRKKTRALIAASAVLAAGTFAIVATTLPAQADDGPSYGEDKGDISTKVVGGEDAPEGAYPWMVRLSMGCGGSMITDQVVLTAAHCVDGTGEDTSVTAYYGANDLNSPDIQERTSAYIHQSETYASDGRGDWALIKLSEPIADAKTIKLATDGTSDEGPNFQLMGWGATSEGGPQADYLQHAEAPYVDDATCQGAYSNLDAEGEICSGLMDEGGIDTCQGDSGGPMVNMAGEEPVQVGIVSWGEGCARPGKPGVYAQVSFWNADINAALGTLP
ncbi:S1 family peptidase [Stackebrandtia nassauensis]|uniref:Peptidase S1 and S6 chymotrypsin/Hap n=1 Tax=Stackebrandtia nassauensis (strain DSM 44728 / CIP 108903 / NRRL B-16338 / NBRC 102104 / LLR-40K-21) TaxID=446470 RepID=D3PW07_STANL|nr:serine protease [Stackebrandtia nassauensis]ADD45128.1 peptidase S1 and S6 chymotrypsin/Hap [Stackebrandtia nassauensis DSM 44728]